VALFPGPSTNVFEEEVEISGKSSQMEQPNHLRRSDQGPKKREDEIQHHYNSNNRHKDDYDYGGKRNGYESFGRGRGGRGGNGMGMRGRGGSGDHFVRNVAPKKIILPPKDRTNKRQSDEEMEDVPMQRVAADQISNHVSVDDVAETHQKQPTPEIEKPETQPQTEMTSEQMISDQQDTTGWFAPRGQPSRRGRGGIGGPVNHRSMNKNDVAGSGTPTLNDDDCGRDSSDDEEKRRQRKDERRGMNVGRGGIRKDDDHPDYRHPRRQNSQPGKVEVIKRGPPPPQQPQPTVVGQQMKQMSYERRQNKLPPRLAKQKEQNRMKYAGELGKYCS
jgi:hypothetical protein